MHIPPLKKNSPSAIFDVVFKPHPSAPYLSRFNLKEHEL